MTKMERLASNTRYTFDEWQNGVFPPKSWDLADAVRDGWAKENIDTFIKTTAGPVIEPKPSQDINHGQTNNAALAGADIRMATQYKTAGFSDFSESDIAAVFVERNCEEYRFDHSCGSWFKWTGVRWSKDEIGLAFDAIRMICDEAADAGRYLSTNGASGAKRIRSAKTIKGVEFIAQRRPHLSVTSAAWDQDKSLLGTPAGTVDLRTGEIRAADPGDMISKIAAVEPSGDAECPQWIAFLSQACAGDASLIKYLQKICGYALTGNTSEHALFFIHGPGGNGKSVFLNVLAGIMGDYAQEAPMETFTASYGNSHPTELAMLAGARLVTASETESGRAWAESRIKSLTGGDMISARFMRQDYFQFKPQFKLLIAGNHAPVLKRVDDAMKRRLRVIPFTNKPATVDLNLERKLRKEWPAILQWMIEGCLAWQKERLPAPDAVKQTTDSYFAEQDLVGEWLAERCIIDSAEEESVGLAFADWDTFVRDSGERPGTKKALTQELVRKGIRTGSTYVSGIRTRSYVGMRLKFRSDEMTASA
ncbi:MAG: phage/plasmid primase, P4 family [Stappiaceae bacterium]